MSSNYNIPIDFNARFMRDFIAWVNKHPELEEDDDKLEAAAARARAKWFAAKKSWLNGISPNEYFFEIDDAAKLISLLISYIEHDMDIPEPLIDCIIDKGDDAYSLMIDIINLDDTGDISPDALEDVRTYFIDLIEEMQRDHPYSRYVTLLLKITEPGDLSETIMRIFHSAPNTRYIRDLLFGAYPLADEYPAMIILDILTDLPDEDGRTSDLLLAAYTGGQIDLDYFATLEQSVGDERALPLLREHLDDADIDYFTYSEIRYAIEAITGELILEREFPGDKDYEKIANLKEDEIFG